MAGENPLEVKEQTQNDRGETRPASWTGARRATASTPTAANTKDAVP